jgi:hypothetical protein
VRLRPGVWMAEQNRLALRPMPGTGVLRGRYWRSVWRSRLGVRLCRCRGQVSEAILALRPRLASDTILEAGVPRPASGRYRVMPGGRCHTGVGAWRSMSGVEAWRHTDRAWRLALKICL